MVNIGENLVRTTYISEMLYDVSALVTFSLRRPTRFSLKIFQQNNTILQRLERVQRVRSIHISSVRELQKKRPQHKVLAAIEESKYNPVDSKTGNVSFVKFQRLVLIMLLANCLIFMGAEHVAPEEMKKVIEEEKSVVIGSFKFWWGVRSKQKEGQATLEQGPKNGSKEYKSPLSEK